jgi:hypothetical protein
MPETCTTTMIGAQKATTSKAIIVVRALAADLVVSIALACLNHDFRTSEGAAHVCNPLRLLGRGHKRKDA